MADDALVLCTALLVAMDLIMHPCFNVAFNFVIMEFDCAIRHNWTPPSSPISLSCEFFFFVSTWPALCSTFGYMRYCVVSDCFVTRFDWTFLWNGTTDMSPVVNIVIYKCTLRPQQNVCWFSTFLCHFDLLKLVKFEVSKHFLENISEECSKIWHAGVSWPPSEQIIQFGHSLFIFILLSPLWRSGTGKISGLQVFFDQMW